MNVPGGWYDQGDGTQRYWDGAAWTEHTAPAAPRAATAAVPPLTPAASHYATLPLAQPSGYAALPSLAPVTAPRKRVWPWVLGIAGGVLLLTVGLVVWGVVAFIGVVTGPIDAVNAFQAAVETGDCAAMERSVTSSLLSSRGWDECSAFEAEAAALAPASFDANESSIVNGTATVTADVRYANDAARYVGTYTVIKVAGDWRVDALSVEASGW